ncbi:unnamed protein product [Symbiodinium sp. CCMP2456]|nr:unnamed protein product [Symbiodinium sp. CCMP2456]
MVDMLRELWVRYDITFHLSFADLSDTKGFHMSWAKNTSHQMALNWLGSSGGLPRDALRKAILVNLDGDNILGAKFIPAMLKMFCSPNLCVVHSQGKEKGTCGRMLVAADIFCEVGGYDQEPDIWPSGYQDIDMRDRCARKGSGHRQSWGESGTVEGAHLYIGCALDNVLNVKRTVERGSAKVKNTSSPDVTWGTYFGCDMLDGMNDANSTAMRRKLKEGRLRRNEGLKQLGWRSTTVRLDEVPRLRAMSSRQLAETLGVSLFEDVLNARGLALTGQEAERQVRARTMPGSSSDGSASHRGPGSEPRSMPSPPRGSVRRSGSGGVPRPVHFVKQLNLVTFSFGFKMFDHFAKSRGMAMLDTSTWSASRMAQEYYAKVGGIKVDKLFASNVTFFGDPAEVKRNRARLGKNHTGFHIVNLQQLMNDVAWTAFISKISKVIKAAEDEAIDTICLAFGCDWELCSKGVR